MPGSVAWTGFCWIKSHSRSATDIYAKWYFYRKNSIRKEQNKSRKEKVMDRKDILKTVDHTLLTQTATWEEIRGILDDGIKYQTASACIPAAYVKQAAEYVEGRLPICTVIGFPNGYSTTAVKVFETKDAIENGAFPFGLY